MAEQSPEELKPSASQESHGAEETPEAISESEMMEEGRKHLDTFPLMVWQRQKELERMRQDPASDSERAATLEIEIAELSDQIDYWCELIGVQVGSLGFRGYTEEEAAEEAKILKGMVDSGEVADYSSAEKEHAKRTIEDLLQMGKGWEAIRMGVESKFIGDDIVMDALDVVAEARAFARERGDTAEVERLTEELRRIEEWRGL